MTRTLSNPMTAVAFDTLKFARSLREKAKMSAEQAEGFADALVDVLDGNLATKGDIREVQADIQGVRGDIEALKIQTRADIDALRLTTQADIESLRLSTKADIDSLRLETMAGIDGLRLETMAGIDGLRLETMAGIDSLRLETKAGIDGLRLETKAEIEGVRGTIAASKVETVRWVVGAVGFQTLAILGTLVALARTLH